MNKPRARRYTVVAIKTPTSQPRTYNDLFEAVREGRHLSTNNIGTTYLVKNDCLGAGLYAPIFLIANGTVYMPAPDLQYGPFIDKYLAEEDRRESVEIDTRTND